MIIYDVLEETKYADARLVCPNHTLRQAACALQDDAVGALAVADDEGKLVGVLTEHALVKAIIGTNHDVLEYPVSGLMTPAVVTCVPSDEIDCVLSLMLARQVAHAPVVEDAEALGMVGILELTRAADLLGARGNKDPLTGLSNREYFVDRLVKEIERCNRYRRALSVARIDIDEFDQVIGKYGPGASVKVVQTLAQLFFNEIRNVDFVGRVGEGEFAVFFPETALDGAEVACKRLLEIVRATKIDIGVREIRITVSIGLTELGTMTAYSLGILDRADQLLVKAKANGKGSVQTDPVLTEVKAHQVA